MKYGLSDKQLKEITDILASYEAVDEAILFGSRAIDTYKEASDIDIAIKGENADWSLAMKIKDHFEEETYLPFFFDVVAYGSVESEELRRHIDRKGKVLFCRGSEGLMENGELTVGNRGSVWREIALSETTKFIVDNRGKTAPTEKTGIPLIATNCINNKNLYPSYLNLRYVSDETYETWFRAHPEPGDILLTLKGSQNGAVCLAPEPVDFVIAQDMVALRADEEVIDPLFLFAALRSPAVQNQIDNLDVSGVIPHLKKTDFDKLFLPYPDPLVQKEIGNIYYNLCKKIDLLHRQNKTLEQMAETLFRQWFVVEAGEDWEEKPLSSVANFLNGLACQKFPPKNEVDKLPVLKIKQLRNGFSDDSDWCTTEVKPEYIIKNGDVIFSWSASLMVKTWDGDKCILNQHLFKVTSDDFPKWYYYLWSKHHLTEFVGISSSHATTMGHIKRGDLDDAMVLVPSPEEIELMTHEMQPLIDKKITNSKQISTLQSLRDTLLPKLMSGEVRVQYDKEAS